MKTSLVLLLSDSKLKNSDQQPKTDQSPKFSEPQLAAERPAQGSAPRGLLEHSLKKKDAYLAVHSQNGLLKVKCNLPVQEQGLDLPEKNLRFTSKPFKKKISQYITGMGFKKISNISYGDGYLVQLVECAWHAIPSQKYIKVIIECAPQTPAKESGSLENLSSSRVASKEIEIPVVQFFTDEGCLSDISACLNVEQRWTLQVKETPLTLHFLLVDIEMKNLSQYLAKL